MERDLDLQNIPKLVIIPKKIKMEKGNCDER
jgi:hypothetical protein